MQPRGSAADVAFREHGLEQHEQVEIHPRQINFMQHIGEIISLYA